MRRRQQREGTGPNKGTVRDRNDRNERVRPTLRDRNTGRNLSPPQYRPSRIRKRNTREDTGKGALRRRMTCRNRVAGTRAGRRTPRYSRKKEK